MENRIVYQIMARNGLLLMFLGLFFGIAETIYFGSNWLPESRAEFICDAISLMIAGGGEALLIYGAGKQAMYDIKELLKNKW